MSFRLAQLSAAKVTITGTAALHLIAFEVSLPTEFKRVMTQQCDLGREMTEPLPSQPTRLEYTP